MDINLKVLSGHESKIETYTFEVSPFTPVFVGSGEKLIRDLDFVTSGNKTLLLDLHKIFKSEIDNLIDLEHAISKQNLGDYLSKRNLRVSDFAKKIITGQADGNELFMSVLTGRGNPMYPGSSLKGSLKSALFNHYFEKRNFASNRNKYRNLITSNGKPKGDKFASQDLQTELLVNNPTGRNGSNPNYDVGRVIRPGDCVFDSAEMEVFNVAVVNQTREGYMWKKLGVGSRYDTNTESLRDATKIALAGVKLEEEVYSKTTISLDHAAQDAIKWPDRLDFKKLAYYCNHLSLILLAEDIKYFEQASKKIPSLGKIVDELEEIVGEIKDIIADNKENSKVAWVQRLGWGSGWLTMTGAHATEENELLKELRNVYDRLGRRNADFPKSRKVVLNQSGQPETVMGWLMVQQA